MRKHQQAECTECGAPAVWRILEDGGDVRSESGYAQATASYVDYCDPCWQLAQDEGRVCWYSEERIRQAEPT